MYTLEKSHNFVYLMFQLLLSGDVELNPGPLTGKIYTLNIILIKSCALVTPGDPRDILRTNSAKLTEAISSNLEPVAVALSTKKLIPQHANRKALVVGLDDYKKASELMIVLQTQLSASFDQRQYLIDVCNVLKDLDGTKDLAITMLQQLGVNVSDSIQQGIVTTVTMVIFVHVGTSTEQQTVPSPATGNIGGAGGTEETDTG